MLVVGLSGGIASGKSTVSRILDELGVPIVDADQLARDVVAVGKPALREIVEVFGAEVLAPNGSLDRKALGQIVFHDEDSRKQLEAITHPRIATESARRFSQLARQEHPFVVYDAPLLIENGLHEQLDYTIIVWVDEETQIERLCARDDIPREEALCRIQSQMPLSDKLEKANFVINNSGSLGKTRRQVEKLHTMLLELA